MVFCAHKARIPYNPSARQVPHRLCVRTAALPVYSSEDELVDANRIQDLSTVRQKSRERPVIQWYPGHIAKAERQLKEQLSKVDIVFEVRDARIINTTRHPLLDEWTHNKQVFLVVNRIDMVSKRDLSAWMQHFQSCQQRVFFTNGQDGTGIHRIIKAADAMSDKINETRVRRGLKHRPVRACVMGFPNIGKSAIINRLLKRRVVDSAARPGVTRSLRWIRMGQRLDLLDAPGIIPMSIGDQRAAEKLAVCNDIADTAYVQSAVAAAYIDLLQTLPDSSRILSRVQKRYGLRVGEGTSEDFVCALGEKLFFGDMERAGQRLLKDYRDCRLGPFALEHPRV